MQLNSVIARVEHHPLGLVLILDEKVGEDKPRIQFFLKKPCREPASGDVLTLHGKEGAILSGNAETHVRQYAPNGLEEFLPLETYGHA